MTDAGAEPNRYPKGVARRRQIVEMAIERFAERGVESASMRDIATAIGISHTALRHYFASRDELLVEVYREYEAGLGHPGPGVPHDPVEIMIDAAERNRAVPGLVQLYANLTTDALQDGHPVAAGFVTERFAQLRDEVAAAIGASDDPGTIDLAALIIAASDGLQLQWMLDPAAVDVARSLRLLARLLEPDPGDAPA